MKRGITKNKEADDMTPFKIILEKLGANINQSIHEPFKCSSILSSSGGLCSPSNYFPLFISQPSHTTVPIKRSKVESHSYTVNHSRWSPEVMVWFSIPLRIERHEMQLDKVKYYHCIFARDLILRLHQGEQIS